MHVRHLATAAVALVFAGQPAVAHHCFDAKFDANAPVVISGNITKTEWINPHTLIHISGANGAGPAKDWVFWAATPNTLLRSGITRKTLVEAAEVTIRGYEAKDKSCPVNTTTQKAACIGDARTITLGNSAQKRIHSSGDGGPGAGECKWGSSKAAPN